MLEHYEECHLGRWKLTSAYLISIISMFCMANACPLPVEASNLFTDAVKAYSEKNYSYSLSKLVDYLRSHPSDPDANYYLALTYSALNRDVEAKRQYAYVVRTFLVHKPPIILCRHLLPSKRQKINRVLRLVPLVI